MFSSENYEILKSTKFVEHLRSAASENTSPFLKTLSKHFARGFWLSSKVNLAYNCLIGLCEKMQLLFSIESWARGSYFASIKITGWWWPFTYWTKTCSKPTLTLFTSMSHFYTPWKRQKTYGFSNVFRLYRNGTLAW